MQQIADVQLIIPCSVIVIGFVLVPDDPSILPWSLHKGDLVQAVFAVQRRVRIMKVLVVSPAIGHSAALAVVKEGDGNALQDRADGQVGQI